MEFKPRVPREDVNVSPTHPLREAFNLVAGLTALFVLAMALLAWGVDLIVTLVPPQTEARLFSALAAELTSFEGSTEQLRRRARAERILHRLAAHWPEAPYQFRLGVMDSTDLNAAALPGGTVLVTSGLLEAAETENELAFVLGHELGHFEGRDHLRRLGRGTVWALGLAVIVGSGSRLPDLPAIMGELTARGFDRDQERDADRFGLELVQAEYGHAAESWRFFERFDGEEAPSSWMLTYASTHPAPADRIEGLKSYARERGYALTGETRPLTPAENRVHSDAVDR